MDRNLIMQYRPKKNQVAKNTVVTFDEERTLRARKGPQSVQAPL
jgi:hypothetical protein